jgi:hypothetical protein
MEIPIFKMNAATRFEHGKIFAPGTLVVSVCGDKAFEATQWHINRAVAHCPDVGASGVLVVGRLQAPLKWYIILMAAAHIRAYKTLQNMEIRDDKTGMTFHISQKEQETVKGTIHWLPLTIKAEGVQEIANFLTRDKNAKVSRIKNTNEWVFHYTPTGK